MNVSPQSKMAFLLNNDTYSSNASWVVCAMIYDVLAPVSSNCKIDILNVDDSVDLSYSIIDLITDKLYDINSLMFDSNKGRLIVSFAINAIDHVIENRIKVDTSDEYTISNSISSLLKTFCGDQDTISVIPGTLDFPEYNPESEYILDKVNNRMLSVIDDEFYDMYLVRNLTTWVCAYIHQNLFEDYDNILGEIECEVVIHKMVDIMKHEMFPISDINMAKSKVYRVLSTFNTDNDPYDHIIATVKSTSSTGSINETEEDDHQTFPTKGELRVIMDELQNGNDMLLHKAMMNIKYDFPYVVWGWFKKNLPLTPRMYTVMQVMSWVAPNTNAYTGKLGKKEKAERGLSIKEWRTNLDRLDPRLPMIAAKFINRRVDNRGGVPADKKLIIAILKNSQKIKKSTVQGIKQGKGNSQARWIKNLMKNKDIQFLGSFREIKERVYDPSTDSFYNKWVEKWVPFYDDSGNMISKDVLSGNDTNTNIMEYCEYMLDKYVPENSWYRSSHLDESIIDDAVVTMLEI